MPESKSPPIESTRRPPPPPKAIILVSGSEIGTFYLANVAPPGGPPALGLVPEGQQPAGVTYTASQDKFPPPPSSAAPFAACFQAYSTPAFVQSGWVLFSGKISSLRDLQGLLLQAAAINPVSVVVHYVGHGIYEPAPGCLEAWSCRGWTAKRLQWADPNGANLSGIVLVPTDAMVNALVSLDSVKLALQQVFPNIPITLITDGCEQQGATRLAAGNAFRVIVCDSVAGPRVVNEGLFTAKWAAVPVVPSCFPPDDTPTNTRPLVIGMANQAMAAAGAPAAGGPQVAASVPP